MPPKSFSLENFDEVRNFELSSLRHFGERGWSGELTWMNTSIPLLMSGSPLMHSVWRAWKQVGPLQQENQLLHLRSQLLESVELLGQLLPESLKLQTVGSIIILMPMMNL